MDRSSSSNFRTAILIFAAIAILFLARLVYLQIIVSDEYSANAQEARSIGFTTASHRGTIYDRNGNVLAVSVDSTTVYCNPSEVTDARYEAQMIADVFGGSYRDYEDILKSDSTMFAYIKRQADVDKAAELQEMGLDGIYFIGDSRREYPNGSIGAQVIGICDVDGNGICGLELQYDDILKGEDGTYSAERGMDGTPIPGGVHEDVKPIDGEDIMVSLDIKLQSIVEEALEEGVKANDPALGNSVVLDSETGEIYAICSYPYLDPYDLEKSEAGSDAVTAITQAIEPGSVFKTFTALSVLEERALSPEDELYVPSYISADGYVISDAHDRAAQMMTFGDILDKSSNVGISLCLNEVGFDKLYDVLGTMRFNEATGVDFPGEIEGIFHDKEDLSDAAMYNIAFGQGIAVTPLQIARAYAIILNDGVMTQPHFLIAMPQKGEWIEYESSQVIEDTEALATLRDMLRNVVLNGTGKLADIDGYEVAGKTSTAEIASEYGGYLNGVYNLCFTGFINNSSTPLVCFVGANRVGYEGTMTPVFHEIMSEAIDLYKVVPE